MDYSPPPSPASQQVLSCLDKSQHVLMGNLMSRNSNHHSTNNAPGSSATDSPSIPSSAAGNEHTSLKQHNEFLMRLHQGHLAAAATTQQSGENILIHTLYNIPFFNIRGTL